MSRKINRIIIILIPFLFSVLQSCKHEPGYLKDSTIIQIDNCSPDTVYFQNEVLPLLQSSCGVSGCHDAASAEHGVIMTDYVNITQTGHVKAGNPGGSKLYRVIKRTGGEKMPPSSQPALSSEQKDLIYKWIEQGAWNLQCTNEPCDSTVFTFSGAVWPIIELNCLGCHSGNNPGAGILMRNYQEISAIANDPRFIGGITHAAPYVPMPYNGNKLSDCKIKQIQDWIASGAPDN
jgi:hypothetical protein